MNLKPVHILENICITNDLSHPPATHPQLIRMYFLVIKIFTNYMEVTVDQQLFGFLRSSKYHLCSAEERNSFRFKTTLEWVNYGIKIKHFYFLVNCFFNVNKTQREKISHYSWLKNFNTIYLIESIYIVFYLYICSFNFLNALLNTPIVPENKTLFVLFIHVYL